MTIPVSIAELVNQKLYFAKILLEQWSGSLVASDRYIDQLILPAQNSCFEESVSYFLVAAWRSLAYELLDKYGVLSEFKQQLAQWDMTDPHQNEPFLAALLPYRKQIPEIGELIEWAQQEESDLKLLLMHYSRYGITAVQTAKHATTLQKIPLQETRLTCEMLLKIHAELTQRVQRFREQMQEW